MNASEVVTISLVEYEELLKDKTLLVALQNAGVHRWEGWEKAVDEYRKNPISMDME